MDRLTAIRAAAAAYDAQPAPGVHRIAWRDLSADVRPLGAEFIVAFRGTEPESFANWVRDADVADEPVLGHPQLGECFAGALNGAEGLLPEILAAIGGAPVHVVGHSLGGQVAVDVAALLVVTRHQVASVWGFDPPKSGGPKLAEALKLIDTRIFRFSGSLVSTWPFLQGQHVRSPTTMGAFCLDPIRAHSISRAAAWVAAHTPPAAAAA